MIEYTVQNGFAEILLANPPVNGITEELMDALIATLTQAGSDPQALRRVLTRLRLRPTRCIYPPCVRNAHNPKRWLRSTVENCKQFSPMI